MREQEKLIEHMVRIMADQAVRMRFMEIAIEKTISHGDVRQVALEVAA